MLIAYVPGNDTTATAQTTVKIEEKEPVVEVKASANPGGSRKLFDDDDDNNDGYTP